MTQQSTGKGSFTNAARRITQAVAGDADLGPLALLPGTWANLRNPKDPEAGPLNGRGWNMIALPFATPPGAGFNYRLLMNQYNERLIITTKDTGVPNRGIQPNPPTGQTIETDQEIVALDYEQGVVHFQTEDFPRSTLTQPLGAAIHHEPGLFLFMKSQTDDGIDIARLGTIPHGNSLIALGASKPSELGAPVIPPNSGLPIGLANPNPSTSPYLEPYQHFIANPFRNLFRPNETHKLLEDGIQALGEIRHTTTLKFSTKVAKAGIVNIPFIEKQADVTEMDVTFWIMELVERGSDGTPRVILMYHQVVMLDFFARTDGQEGLIKWPHVSINAMERIATESQGAPLTSSDITAEALE